MGLEQDERVTHGDVRVQTATVAGPPPPATGLRAVGVRKVFGSTVALADVDMVFERGRVHGLIGENGSGKSTFVKIVAGVHTADAGSVSLDGDPVAGGGASRGADRRVACVYQDGSLIEELTVGQNLDLLVEPASRPEGARSWQRTVLDDFGLERISPDDLVAGLPTNERRLVEIAGVLARRPDVLLFDESTSSLDEHGVASVLEAMRRAAAAGACVVFVTHRLHEVLAVTERIVVLRDGAVVDDVDTATATPATLVRRMAGRDVASFDGRAATRTTPGEVVVQATAASGRRFGPLDLSVRAGEIVGIGGASGNGQSEFIRALAGDGVRHGTVQVGGTALKRAESATDAGAVFVSSDRRSESLATLLSVRENYTLALDGTQRGWWHWISRDREVRRADELADGYGLARRSLEQPVATLSGGNQQKVALGRAVAREPVALFIEEPTEGVDVRSRYDIYRSLLAAAERGAAVVFTSSDASELRLLADRVVVMADGRAVAELSGGDVTEDAIVHAFTTAKDRLRAGADDEPTRRRAGWHRLSFSPSTFVLLALLLVAVGVYGSSRDSDFGSFSNVQSILSLAVPLAFAAFAQLPVLLVREIDASLGSMMGLIVVLLSYLPHTSVALLIVMAVAVGAVLGAVNALLVVRLRINSVIATIATLGVFLGIGRILRPTPGGLVSIDLTKLLTLGLAGIPLLFVVAIVLAVVVDVLVNGTRAGLRTRAVGYASDRATQLGVRSNRLRAAMFVLAGAIAGFGAVALAAQTGVGDPGAGQGYTLLAIAVPVIGGALLSGGRGSALGCLLAAVFVAEIQNLIPFVNLPTGGYLIAVGVLTVVALVVGSVSMPSRARGTRRPKEVTSRA